MDLATILKAIEIVGAATPAAMRLYEGFKVLVSDADREELRQVLAVARAERSASWRGSGSGAVN